MSWPGPLKGPFKRATPIPVSTAPMGPTNDGSNFDMARLKFCPHCGQLLPQQTGLVTSLCAPGGKP